ALPFGHPGFCHEVAASSIPYHTSTVVGWRRFPLSLRRTKGPRMMQSGALTHPGTTRKAAALAEEDFYQEGNVDETTLVHPAPGEEATAEEAPIEEPTADDSTAEHDFSGPEAVPPGPPPAPPSPYGTPRPRNWLWAALIGALIGAL